MRLCTAFRLPFAMLIPILLTAACSQACGQATAGQASIPYTYKNVAIVAGGFISGIVAHPGEKGLFYARTDIGGAYRWEEAAGRWIPLNDWVGFDDSNLLGIESIGLDPTDPKRLYLAVGTYTKSWAGNGAMLRSSDQGRTFEKTDLPIKLGGNEYGRFAGERLAVDPNQPTILYFGSRDNGLWRSADRGVTWASVGSFPKYADNGTGAVVVNFLGSSGKPGAPTPTIYVGVSAPDGGLFRSTDAGASWQPVAGQPTGLLINHAALGSDGVMYVSYGNNVGPNDMTDGAVWRFETVSGKWKNITPDIPGAGSGAQPGYKFGYGAVTVSATDPKILLASTMDRWYPGDELFRSTDGGGHWKEIASKAPHDTTLSPWLGGEQGGNPGIGHWVGALCIDPFDAEHALYGTGQTLWATRNAGAMDANHWPQWFIGALGIEETADITLLSPPAGPHLLSGLGDISGFRHDDLDVTPQRGNMRNPTFSATDSIDASVADPALMVRVGSTWGKNAFSAISHDGGASWQPFPTQPEKAQGGSVALSADGKSILWAPREGPIALSTDLARSWRIFPAAPAHAEVVSDRVFPTVFYLHAADAGKVFASPDGGANFSIYLKDLPKGHLMVSPAAGSDLWLASEKGLYHSSGPGQPMLRLGSVEEAYGLGFGKGAEGATYPTLFLAGKVSGTKAIFRSTDEGKSWQRINDAQHQYGWIGHISGDPRIFGRVYLGTNGRGVLYGDPAMKDPKQTARR